MIKAFRVYKRNPGDWDISVDGARVYQIRSYDECVMVIYDNVHGGETNLRCETMSIAIGWITDRLMKEEKCQVKRK